MDIKLQAPHFNKHPFHLVDVSPWPFLISFSLLTTTLSAVMYFHGIVNGGYLLTLGLLTTVATMFIWWQNVVTEGTFQGHHTFSVQTGLNMGVLLFIVSEIFFFLSIFWAFFHSALSPTVELGSHWPPAGILPLNPWEIPLLNTVILLSSGASVTWGHHALIKRDRTGALLGIIITVVLAFIFTALQGVEYIEAPFTFADGVYGTCFFMGTGFHGLHVMIGTLFILVGGVRLYRYQLTNMHHLGLEGSILYWHMVDVVWLFLFVCMYWWGS